MKFEWDENKNEINKKKHGISFEDVESVFSDFSAIIFDDPDHSETEERFLIIGMSLRKGICIVGHCYRNNENIIRIISARKATKNEQMIYINGI
ncbi:BrnT family toxin [Fenollaria massiliensis]|uniref:BrnT family toxin n=1 Tax=Fenollaria massiliensis TaxID=938288 RepID=A0A9E7DIQ7_9FIRM|nr:BrnT family toxin [Fenollaria massiliensis]UQK58908.1 BrnT family toxin [Fenollaria massiliensis]